MTAEMLLVFGLLTATIVLFLTDRLRLDLVAILALLALLLTGVLTPEEALAGFADPLVLTIAGLFVVGAGLFRTGVADALGQWLGRVAGASEVRLLVVIMLIVALLSAFISSTGTVAVFLPVVVSLAWSARISPSKLLIPLAYASLIGGMLTLIGTPPNIAVSSQLVAEGRTPFGFFAFTPIGLVMLAVGVLFMVFVGRHIMPDRGQPARSETPDGSNGLSPTELVAAYQLPGNWFRLRVRRASPLIGQTLAVSNLRARYGVNVLEVQPWPEGRASPLPPRTAEPTIDIAARDILYVQGAPAEVAKLAQEQWLAVLPPETIDQALLTQELRVAEVLLTPRSRLIDHTLQEMRFRDAYKLTVLGILRMGEPLQGDLPAVPLRFGDALLVQGKREALAALRAEQRDFVVVGQPREMLAERSMSRRAPLAVAIMLGMLGLMTFGGFQTVTAVLLAATAMVLTGCLSMEDVYRRMSWESVVLIAGMLPMATALQKTGGVAFIASGLTAGLGAMGPLALMAGLFLMTSLFSQFISNTATTVLVAPIAFQVALSLGVAPEPLLMMVAVAASTSFATPIASPVNTLVLGPGGYRFADFAKVGVPLQILLMVMALLVVPLFFPL